MQMLKSYISKLAICLLAVQSMYPDALNFDSRYSTIKVNSGAKLLIKQPIPNFNGTLIKSAGSTITGQLITFNDGLLEDAGNSILMSAIFNPSGFIIMNGNDTLRADPSRILQTVSLSGSSNRIEGSPLFATPLVLQDSSTSVTLALQGTMNQNIVLNGGSLFLDNHLDFYNERIITGSGTIHGNGYRISTGNLDTTWGSDVTWTNVGSANLELHACETKLTGTWRFTGETYINGHGNVLELGNGGTIIINPNSKLHLADVTVKGLGAGGGSLLFVNDSSQLTLCGDVHIELVGDITTTLGGIYVNGPTSWILKDFDWKFDQLASLTVDGVTLWLDQAGKTTLGDVLFGAPQNNFLSLIASGTIKNVCCDNSNDQNLKSRVEVLETCCDRLRTSTGFLQSQVDVLRNMDNMLKTSTGFLQSQIDRSVSVVDTVRTSTGFLQSQLDKCCSELKTSTGFLQSQVDVLRNMDNMLKTSTGFLQSQIDRSVSVVDTVRTSTGFLQSQLDKCCSELKTSTGFLQSQVDVLRSMDNMLKTSTGFLQSQIDAIESCCDKNGSMIDMLKTSTGFLQSQIDRFVDNSSSMTLLSRVEVLESCCDKNSSMIDMLKTSTGFLQSQVDVADSCCDVLKTSTGFLQSQLDKCCTALKTSTGFLQSQIDSNVSMVSMLKTSTGFLQSQLDKCCSELKTSTGFLQSQVDVLRNMDNMLKTSTGFLQSQIDAIESCCDKNGSMIDMLKTSTGFLQSQVDVADSCCDVLKTSTGFLQSQLDKCCTALKTSTGFLQSQIDSNVSMVSMLKTSTGFLQSQLDKCCSELKTSTGFLQSQVDVLRNMDNMLKTSTGFLQSQIDAIESCCDKNGSMIDMLKTSTGFLQSQVDVADSCCDVLKTSTGFLQSQLDKCCTELKTSTGFLQSQIDAVESCCDKNGSMIDMLKTSTGFLQSQIDRFVDGSSSMTLLSRIEMLESCCDKNSSMVDMLKTSTGFLQSQIDVADSCCDVLKTSTGFLQSQLDKCCTELKTSTGFLQSQIDAVESCCDKNSSMIDMLKTSTGFLQSQIDVADSCCDVLKTSTGLLQSQLDKCCTELKTSTGFLQSQIDAVESCCDKNSSMVDMLKTSTGFLQSQIDVADSCCDVLKTSTGFLQSQLDKCCTELKTSTGFLQSQIDAVESCCDKNSSMIDMLKTSTGFLQSQIDVADSCCDVLKTSTGFLQSQLDKCCTELKTSTGFLQSQIDAVESCCDKNSSMIDMLKTSTGFLQSQIDVADSCCDVLKTSTGFLQSQLDKCCTELKTSTGFLQSQIDAVESCCDKNSSMIDMLKTSTGFLQSQLDMCCSDSAGCDCLSICEPCKLFFTTKTTHLESVETLDWSFDGRFLAVGLEDDLGADFKVLKVYELVGASLVLRAEHQFNRLRAVTVVRWHPTLHRLAVGRADAEEFDNEPQLHIFDFNSLAYTLSQVGVAEIDTDVFALSWRTALLAGGDSALAVGRDVSAQQLAVYPVSPAGVLGAILATGNTQEDIQTQALDWKQSTEFIVLGAEQVGSNNSLQVWTFVPAGPALVLNAAVQIPAVPGNPLTVTTVRAVDWNMVDTELIALGLQGTTGQLAQVYEHNSGAGTLVYRGGIAGLNTSVLSVDWQKDGRCLALGKAGSLLEGGEFRTYNFKKSGFVFTQINEFNNTLDRQVETVRWSPDGKVVANGAGNGDASVYRNKCIPFEELVSRVENLETCCDELKTSTGFLQSQIDAVESCCESNDSMIEMLKTSTGFLQSQIDEIESCCDGSMITMLKTSTGFLQSQIDACCSLIESMDSFTLLSRIESLETCCDELKTSTGFLQSQIDALESCCESNDSMIDMLKTSTGFLQSQIDECCKCRECFIVVEGDLYFDYSMLPAPNTTVVFEFCPCFGDMNLPRVIFDPSVYDPLNLNGGFVELAINSRVVFQGEGIVEVKNGVNFYFLGEDCQELPTGLFGSDWPQLIVEERAKFHLDNDAIVTVGGRGIFQARDAGFVSLDNPSQLIFGTDIFDCLVVRADGLGAFILDDSNALLTFQLARYDVVFNQSSNLSAIRGTVEFNMNKGLPAAGILNRLHFTEGSSIQLRKVSAGINVLESGLIVMSPNLDDVPVRFDNRTGIVFGGENNGSGHIQFINFDTTPMINTKLLIKDNYFALTRPIDEIFMELALILKSGPAIIDPSDIDILVRFGSPNAAIDANLAALSPLRNGSAVALQEGDHDVAYDGLKIIGKDINGNQFEITGFDINGQGGTRITITSTI